MRKPQFLTPVVTAFTKDGQLDVQANQNIYDHLIQGGIDGLVIMGSTGEFFAMATEQKKELIDLAVKHVKKRVKLYIGTSCMSVKDTVELSNYALSAGADAVMIISPYYFKLSPESIELFYDEIAAQVRGAIYLYNFPDRTGYDLTPTITLSLVRKHNNIVGYKDTVNDMAHTRELIQKMQVEFPDFEVFSGYDENYIHNILCGGSGCIGGLSNLAPELFAAWGEAIVEKNVNNIEKIQHVVDKLMEIYNISSPFIPVMKKAMMLRGIGMQDYCTLPFLQTTVQQDDLIKGIMKETALLD